MNFEQAIKILAYGPNHARHYEATQVVEEAVLAESRFADPDHSLQDWIDAGDYNGTETAKAIAAEWDEDRV